MRGPSSLRQIDDKGHAEYDKTDCNGSLKAARRKVHHSLCGEERKLTAAIKEEYASLVSDDRIGPEAIETSKNLLTDGDKPVLLSRR